MLRQKTWREIKQLGSFEEKKYDDVQYKRVKGNGFDKLLSVSYTRNNPRNTVPRLFTKPYQSAVAICTKLSFQKIVSTYAKLMSSNDSQEAACSAGTVTRFPLRCTDIAELMTASA